ncbi:PAS domain-containing protein [Pseudomonas sp. CDFA 602]|uniref:PAS domain-containing protein n=1 Tax=Pseudomonas californiensis TaxID=2829823 RepID=UPI001E55D129|nr:PAS domain-containing protein [Pseudomonas californiensis]MCD5993479.1 PAS domain-containing protein [Pseudomonas californiensis]MCD5999074.1 PAS domain-containing protein [Pseudomonas californiensis]
MFFNGQRHKQLLGEQMQRYLEDQTGDTSLLTAYPHVQQCLERHARQLAEVRQQLAQHEQRVLDKDVQLQRGERERDGLSVALEQAQKRELGLEAQLREQGRLFYQHQQQAQIWELLQSTLTEGCWDITVVDGNLQHADSCMRFSRQFRLLLGYGADELPDGWDAQVGVTHPDDLPLIMAVFDREILDVQGSGEYVFEYRMKHKTRDYIWCRERGLAVRDAQRRLTRVIGAVRDISDERSAQSTHQHIPPAPIGFALSRASIRIRSSSR